MNEEPETKKTADPWKVMRIAFYFSGIAFFLGVARMTSAIPPFEEWSIEFQYCLFWLQAITFLILGLLLRP